jgi:uncharacterized protein (TIGR03435 family)
MKFRERNADPNRQKRPTLARMRLRFVGQALFGCVLTRLRRVYNLNEGSKAMPQSILRPLLLLAAGCIAYAQDAGAGFEFEAASIKLAPPPDPRGSTMGWSGGPNTDDPGTFRAQNLDLLNLITMAYSMNSFQVAAPEWMGIQKFDIDAKIPSGTTKDQFHAMLQNLLVSRFQLAVHHESKEMAKYDLVLAKTGPRFKEAAAETAPEDPGAPPPPDPPKRFATDKEGCPVLPRLGYGMMTSSRSGRYGWYVPRYSMEMLAGWLAANLGKPVTDATGLTGQYEISLCWAADSLSAARAGAPPPGGEGSTASLPEAGGPTLMSALQDQLGLRLEARKGPVDFLVVDHAEKLPTGN